MPSSNETILPSVSLSAEVMVKLEKMASCDKDGSGTLAQAHAAQAILDTLLESNTILTSVLDNTGASGGSDPQKEGGESAPGEESAGAGDHQDNGEQPSERDARTTREDLFRQARRDLLKADFLQAFSPDGQSLPLMSLLVVVGLSGVHSVEDAVVAILDDAFAPSGNMVKNSTLFVPQILVIHETYYDSQAAQRAHLTQLLNHGRTVILLANPAGSTGFVKTNVTARLEYTDFRQFAIRLTEALQDKHATIKVTLDGRLLTNLISAGPVIPPENADAIFALLYRLFVNDLPANPMPDSAVADLQRFGTVAWASVPDIDPHSPQTIDAVPGLHPHTRRKILRTLNKVQRGEPLRQGVLLYGPPGTGKTMLARLIAKESNRAYIHASCAEWQSNDDLGKHLTAIQNSFKEATQSAPSVMFLDEMDSIGRRGGGSSDYYVSSVVNAMLECVQNAIAANVLVIGATNRPDDIDPALRRPGRMGEQIAIPLPNEAGMREVVHFYFDKFGFDTEAVARRVGVCSPAKLMAFSDEIQEIAIEHGRSRPTQVDLEQGFAQEAARLLHGRDMNRLAMPLAIGLCAKARMAYLIWGEQARIHGISLQPGLVDLGRLEMPSVEEFSMGTAAEAMMRLHFELSPAAGRRAAALAEMEAGNEMGFAECLAQLDSTERERVTVVVMDINHAGLRPNDHGGALSTYDATTQAEATLKSGWQIALKSAKQGMPGIRRAATHLVAHGYLDGELLQALLFDEVVPKELVPVSLH